MFGYVIANPDALTPEQLARYKGAYCGLCRTLKARHGSLSRLTLTYDMTFLILLLESMYEPETDSGSERCAVHPLRAHAYTHSAVTDYAADMNLALAYQNCLDDWKDEKRIASRAEAALLRRGYDAVKELYPEMQVTGYCDNYVKKLERARIDVDLSWLAKRLGKNLSDDVIRTKLELLGFEVQIEDGVMHVTAPTWRSTGDISIKDDVMEEVARLYGYDNFEATSFTTSFEGAINQKKQDLIRNIKEYLAIRCGLQEVYTYPWMNDTFVNAILQSTDGVLKLSTPPAPELSHIRCSLLPNLCEAAAKNERYFDDFSIFEEAQVFFDRNYSSPYDETESLPEQRRHIAAAFASSVKNIGQLFRETKGVLEYMSRYTHMEALSFRKEEKPVWADQVVWLNVYRGEEKVGDMGLLAKKASMDCGIKNLSVMLFELDTEKLQPLKSRTNHFTHLAAYPETDYDISMLFDSGAAWTDIYDAVMGKKKASALLKEASFVDEYRGKQIPAGKKSVTIRLTIGSEEKTLTSQEIENAANQVMKKLEKKMGAQLRTQ